MPEEKNTQQAPSSREAMLAMARERFPDRRFSDIGAPAGEEGVSDLDDAIKEMLDGYASREAEADGKNTKMRDLLVNDPDFADVMQKTLDTGDFRGAVISTFGDDLVNASQSEEGMGQWQAGLDEWRNRKAENERLDTEAQENYQHSIEELDAWGDEKGLSIEQKRDVFMRLLDIALGGLENKYTRDDYELALKAINHDTDVESARTEGEVAGRNARIAQTRRERTTPAGVPPASGGRMGGSVVERPEKPRSPWAGIK